MSNSLKLLVYEHGEDEPAVFNLSGDDAVVGRDDSCDIVIDDSSVSGRHGVLKATGIGYTFTDLASSNGSALCRADAEPAPIDSGVPTPVGPGDQLILGSAAQPVRLVLEAGQAPYAQVQSTSRTVVASEPLTDLLSGREEGLVTLAARSLAARDAKGLAEAALDFLRQVVPAADGRAVFVTGAGIAGAAGAPMPVGLREAALEQAEVVLLSDEGDAPLPMTESIARHGASAALLAPLKAGGVHHGVLAAWSSLGAGTLPRAALHAMSVAASLVALSAGALATRRQGEHERERLRAENARLRGGAARPPVEPIGDSAVFRKAVDLARSVASSDVPILLRGETGTGKEVLARNAHAWSHRADKPFIAFNCAAIPESLIESELFGHVRGAFTGAGSDRKGLFEEANGGTLFLDEIGEMPPVMQAKLLRVLQDGEVRRVGASRPSRVDVRVISATHRDLPTMVGEGTFRADLMYRLNAVTIQIPALKARGEDISVLAHFLLGRACRQARKQVPGFAPDALWALSVYAFPGNVRELENEIMRAVALTPPGQAITAAAFSDNLCQSAPAPASLGADSATMTLKQAVAQTERAVIEQTLARTGGNVSRAAKELGLTRPGLYKVMERIGMR